MREKMDVALRVLAAIHERTDPIRSDIESLQNWVDPPDRDASPSDMACMIILAELHLRKKLKSMGESEGATA